MVHFWQIDPNYSRSAKEVVVDFCKVVSQSQLQGLENTGKWLLPACDTGSDVFVACWYSNEISPPMAQRAVEYLFDVCVVGVFGRGGGGGGRGGPGGGGGGRGGQGGSGRGGGGGSQRGGRGSRQWRPPACAYLLKPTVSIAFCW